MEIKEPASNKVAPVASPASPTAQGFPDVSRISAVFDEYIKRDWAEELDLIQELGATDDAIITSLKTNKETGLTDDDDTDARTEMYGVNYRAPPKRITFFEFAWEAFKDLTLRVLLFFGVVSLFIGIFFDKHPEIGWIEGFAIIAAVFIVIMVTAINDY
jgi:magnesium-transporting ATPase (P-type)